MPIITNLELALAIINVLKQRDINGVTIRSVNEYMEALPWKLC
ncbi:MAG: hypothetical protein NWF10_01655 [Candidatus Bathyarchaeota archaeon]|nr:hypothetical protein [Candidatus Bathyarchaeota archaeon]